LGKGLVVNIRGLGQCGGGLGWTAVTRRVLCAIRKKYNALPFRDIFEKSSNCRSSPHSLQIRTPTGSCDIPIIPCSSLFLKFEYRMSEPGAKLDVVNVRTTNNE
jgi:hypothetical protein